MRHPTTRGGQRAARRSAADFNEAQRIADIQRNPRIILDNIFSRERIKNDVRARELLNPEGGRDAAIEATSQWTGVPVDVIKECLAIETMETGR